MAPPEDQKPEVPAGISDNPMETYDPFRTNDLVREMMNLLGEKPKEETLDFPQIRHPQETVELSEIEAAKAWRKFNEGSSPPYTLISRVARGGFGEVWEAIQNSLSRIIAVKRLREELTRGESEAARLETGFRQEAIIAGKLDHPNIVPVYDLGVDQEGHPALAMKLVRGEPWSDKIERDFLEIDVEEFLNTNLQILSQVSQAVAFAHSRGILHRDLKPTQVMLGDYGEVLLMDWGLAMVYDKDSATRSTSLELPPVLHLQGSNPAGTPSFMAPEQTLKVADQLGPWTDVYLLGGMLYYLLTGKPPHHAPSSREAFEMARDGEVPPPEIANSERYIPNELSEICSAALHRDPKSRIQTADEFTKKIKAYLLGLTRRGESRELVSKARTLLDGSGSHYGQYAEVLELLRQAQVLWPTNREIDQLRHRTIVEYIRQALSQNDLSLARVLLDQIDATGADGKRLKAELKARENQALRAESQRKIAIIGASLLFLVIVIGGIKYLYDQEQAQKRLIVERDRARDAQMQAESAEQRAVEQRQIAERAQYIAEREQYFSSIGIAEFSLEEGALEKARDIIFNKSPEQFRNWEWGHLVAGLYPESMRLNSSQQIFDAVYTADGSAIITGGMTHVARWDAKTGKKIWATKTSDKVIWSVSVSHDDRFVLAGSYDFKAVILDARSGELLHRMTDHRGILRKGDIAPDGIHGVTAGADHRARIWNLETGQMVDELVFAQPVYTATYSPDGRYLAISSMDDRVSIWSTEDYSHLRDCQSFGALTSGLAFSNDSTKLATSTGNRYMRTFNVETGQPITEVYVESSFTHGISFSPDDSLIVAGDDLGYGHIWDANTGEQLATFQADDPMWKVDYSPDGEWILTTSRRSVRVFSVDRILNRQTRNETPSIDEMLRVSSVTRVFGLPDERSPTWQGAHLRWETPVGGTIIDKVDRSFLVLSRFSALSPNRTQRIHINEGSLRASVYDVASGEKKTDLDTDRLIYAEFSPDGSLAATGELYNTITLWDTEAWEPVRTLDPDPKREIMTEPDKYYVHSFTFNQDGSLLAAGYLNHRVVIWDVATGEQVGTLEEVDGTGMSVAFSPDGKLIASGSNEDMIALWNLETMQLDKKLVGHRRTVWDLEFSPDSKRLLSVSGDRTAKLWDVDSGREIKQFYAAETDAYQPLSASFGPSGMTVMIPTADGNLLLFESFPWTDEVVSDAPENMGLEQRYELWKRRQRISPQVDPSDI